MAADEGAASAYGLGGGDRNQRGFSPRCGVMPSGSFLQPGSLLGAGSGAKLPVNEPLPVFPAMAKLPGCARRCARPQMSGRRGGSQAQGHAAQGHPCPGRCARRESGRVKGAWWLPTAGVCARAEMGPPLRLALLSLLFFASVIPGAALANTGGSQVSHVAAPKEKSREKPKEAAREKAVRDKAAREKAARDKAAKEKAAREKAERPFIIRGDHGGYVEEYKEKYHRWRDKGRRVVIDGVCNSACTLVLGIVPLNRICATPRASLGFHKAYYGSFSFGIKITSAAGTSELMSYYPDPVKDWLRRNGGLSTEMKTIRNGAEMWKIVDPCPEEW